MKYTILILGSLILTELSHAQILQRGQGWFRLNEHYISSDSYFNAAPGSMTEMIRTNSYYITSVTGEYAIISRLTATVSFPFCGRATINELQYNQSGNTLPGGSLNSVGDSEVGVRYTFRKKLPIQITGFVTLGLPIGKVGDISSETNLQTGDGEFNQLIGLQLRQSFSKFFITGYAAFNNRTNDFSNEIRYGLEAGYWGDKFRAKARYNVIESLFNDTAPVSVNGFYSNHRELSSPGLEVAYYFMDNVGAFASADFITGGRNTLNAPLFGVGVEVRVGRGE